MAGITSSVGVISGFPIQDTIEKLMKLAARPKDLLLSRNKTAQNEQLAIGKLEALVLALQTSTQKLAKSDTFDKLKATSADDKLLAAVATGSPAAGSYSFTPVRLAQAQQLLSSGFAANNQPLGAGTFSIGFGGFANDGVALDQLNGGLGVRAGKIRITDRSGASADVDLRFAQTIDDVLNAISTSDQINVQAVADGDRIRLIDKTGLTASNLRVQEIGGGSTASDLGFAGLDIAASEATGQDISQLYTGLALGRLNNGNGLSIRDALPDLEISFRDGSAPLQIDFHHEQTIDELLATINAAAPTRLHAQLSADGDHIEFKDLTADNGGTFAVSSPLGGSLAEDLGLTGAAVGDTLTSGRLHAGLKTSLLRSLNGGRGLGALGAITLTDRSGATANINLGSAETLDEVINTINAAGLGITARYNDARNGLLLTDTTGATVSNLIVANGDATNTADKLQLTANTASTKINSGSLARQSISESTTLSSLNGGKGIFKNTIIFTDSNGSAGSIRLRDSQFETVGDLIDGINGLGIGIQARLNETGDGLLLVDTGGGALKLKVRDAGTGRAAQELHIAGESTTIDVGGVPTEAINGRTTFSVTLSSTDTLQDLVTKINGLNAGVAASTVNVGSGATPFRLSLTSQRTGKAGELRVDSSQTGFTLAETAAGQDALLAVGGTTTNPGLLVSSPNNDFENVISGVKLTVKGTSTSPIAVTVDVNTTDILDTVKKLVADYNKLRDELDSETEFNATDGSTGALFGSHVTLRVDHDLADLLSGRILGAGLIHSLGELGLGLDDKGKLQLDETQFKSQFDANPAAVKDFFTHADTGAAVRLNNLIEELAGKDKSLMETQKTSLQNRIDINQQRIDLLTIRLENQRALLERQFFAMENAIAKLQANQSSLDRLAQLANTNTSSNNR